MPLQGPRDPQSGEGRRKAGLNCSVSVVCACAGGSRGRKKACPVAPWVSEIPPASDARVEDARPSSSFTRFLFVCLWSFVSFFLLTFGIFSPKSQVFSVSLLLHHCVT